MAAVVHRFYPRACVINQRLQGSKSCGKDGVQKRAAFNRAGGDEGKREQHAALREHRLLPRHAGIARGEDVIQRNRPAFVAGQGRDGRGIGAGGGHVV